MKDLLAAFIVDGFILIDAFKSASKASPATCLVFYEDLVATTKASVPHYTKALEW